MVNLEKQYDQYWRAISSDKEEMPPDILASDLYGAVDSALRKGGNKLLDVGCGNGVLVEIVKDKFANLYGCDISKTAANEAKKRGMDALCVDFNNGYLPYADASIDNISCIEVIEHVIDPQEILKEMYRILLPGGKLVLTTPNIRYFRNLACLTFKGIFPHTTASSFVWGGGHFHYFTRKDLVLLLSRVGFKKIKFQIAHGQFRKSWKRRLIHKIAGDSIFGEWFCGGIIVEAAKG